MKGLFGAWKRFCLERFDGLVLKLLDRFFQK